MAAKAGARAGARQALHTFTSCSLVMMRPRSSGNLDGDTVLITAIASLNRLVRDSFCITSHRKIRVRERGSRGAARETAPRPVPAPLW